MANDWLTQQTDRVETREESLSRQFYEWERRGRGWQVYDFPVELEPAFRPFYLSDANSEITDDGRKQTFFSNLLDGWRGNSGVSGEKALPPVATQPRSPANDEPLFCQYYNEEFTEFQIALPPDFKLTAASAEQFLLSLSYAAHPVSFEVIGTKEKIIVQMAATGKDAFQLKQQLKSHFPPAVITETSDALIRGWAEGDGGFGVIVDFGLSEEFMLPLNAHTNADLLISLTGALSNLEADETGIYQVLFRRVKYDWADEMMGAVRFFDGTPFFINAPEMIPLAKEKTSRPLFAAVLRVAAGSSDEKRCRQIIRSLGASFAPLCNPFGNELIPLSNENYYHGHHETGLIHRHSHRSGMILNSAELVALVHPPSASVRAEKLVRESLLTRAAPGASLNHPFILGENSHQNQMRKVSLSSEQRTRHLHLIGSSGSGKSTLLSNLIKQDLKAGHGLCVIDPHGDLIDAVIENVPDERINDVIVFDPSDSEYPIGFNILQANSELEKNLLSSDLVATFRRMSTSWGDVMDSVLANAILAFVESERGGTLFDLKRFLVEKDFRHDFLETVADSSVKYFWQQEFPHLAGKPQSSILIRLDAFLRQRLVRNIVCQKQTRLDFRQIMDNRKILLIKLSQGLIGEENAYLLGTLLVSKLYQTALSRQDSKERPYFWLYLDEFHHFITPSMESILSGARKYNLGLNLAHQEFRQLQSRSGEVASSVLSNCYTRICFRLGDADAERFAAGFSFFDAKALQNLSIGEAIARVERAEYDFNLRTYSSGKVTSETAARRRKEIIELSRKRYSRSRSEVEAGFIIPAIIKETIPSPVNTVKEKPPIISPAAPPPSSTDTPAETAMVKDTVIKSPKPATPHSAAVENNFNLPAADSLPPKKTIVSSDADAPSHRYLQSLVKRMAEARGLLATVEKQVFGGSGRIDVALESGGAAKIACEISVTNQPAYEIQNIRKCLAAGFSPVLMISQDARHLEKIRRRAEAELTAEELGAVKFFTPEEFYAWLESVEIAGGEKSEQVNGIKVNVKLKPVDEASRATRKKAISEVVFGAIKKLRKKPPEK